MSGPISAEDPLLEMYLFESSQLIEQLEATFLLCESAKNFSSSAIGDIFRNMHTIKGSAAMMSFMSISEVAHVIEDLFYRIREDGSFSGNFDALFELIWDGLDFIKIETHKIRNGSPADGDASAIVQSVSGFLENVYEKADSECVYEALVHFSPGCMMENVRAFSLLHQLRDSMQVISSTPSDIAENEGSAETIIRDGFRFIFRSSESEEQVLTRINQTPHIENVQLFLLDSEAAEGVLPESPDEATEQAEPSAAALRKEISSLSLISVHVEKLDKLMDLVGEMVIAEAMVTQHDALKDIASDPFFKAAAQLRKITGELQDIVMSIRMVPLTTTFQKMHRVIRDMGKNLNKDIHIQIVGEDTEVDKNIIEKISDPLMHLVRNAVDHGLETPEERLAAGKNATGTVTLEAKNAGSDVLIMVKDDGKGLDKTKIQLRALEQGLLADHQAELSDREIFNLIFLPGFSTKEGVTQYSGRGVGMDVVYKNIENAGGTILVESVSGAGTTISIKIPLTLAIIDGMNIKAGNSHYTLPITSIQESFKPIPEDVLYDPDGNEMIMVRGECYPILRLEERMKTGGAATELTQGILIMVRLDERKACILVDELLGQQQVVVKSLPPYINKLKNIKELAGCTLLGDGSISLILDAAELIGSASRSGAPTASAIH